MIMRFWVLLLEETTLGVKKSVKRKNENMMFGAGQLQAEKAKIFMGTFKKFWKAISECLQTEGFSSAAELAKWSFMETNFNHCQFQQLSNLSNDRFHDFFRNNTNMEHNWANPVFRRLDHFCPRISNHSLFNSLCLKNLISGVSLIIMPKFRELINYQLLFLLYCLKIENSCLLSLD